MIQGPSHRQRRVLVRFLATSAAAALSAGVLGAAPALAAGTSSTSSTTTSPALVTDPASLVDPFVGTGNGGQVVGEIDTFPGATMPFGMLQWSPDTSPDRTAGGGYYYADNQIMGLSLTHLSGPGCSVMGDFPILPTTGAVPTNASDLQNATESFSHSDESASPGYYQVGLGSPAINMQVTTTLRAGISQITYPAGAQANLLIKAGDSQTNNTAASVAVVGNNEVTGSTSTGGFCGAPNTYNVYFAAEFDTPFTAHGTWANNAVTAGSSSASATNAGAYLTFNTTSSTTVQMKVAISYVSAANALQNLNDEIPNWDFNAVHSAATAAWNADLSKVQIGGGTKDQQEQFYTGLYHTIVDPSLDSDVNGQYPGFDGKVHTLSAGQAQYSAFSGWDIYRSAVPLMTLVDPQAAGQMADSLTRDQQQGGWLPKWPVVAGYTGVMNGDAADPILAEIQNYGGANFDAQAALTAMIHGASTLPTSSNLGQGWYEERPDLASYLKLGYVPNTSASSISPVDNGTSETLEYAEDDFAIAQMAQAQGDTADYNTFMKRAQNWQNQLNPATGYLQPRDATGAYPSGDPTTVGYSSFGQSGFQEGNAAQYNWLVPQNYAGLIASIGGNAAVNSRLNTFFSQFNVGPNEPYYWAGNEIDLEAPYVYDYSGAPAQTQKLVRELEDQVYALSPNGEPGNDDLGAMSSWLDWSMLGLYPVTPGSDELTIGTPTFPEAVLHLPGGHTLTINAHGAADNAPYVQSLTVNGQSSDKLSITISQAMASNTTLDFTMGTSPSSWGTAPADAPPSYTTGMVPATSSLSPTQLDVTPGGWSYYTMTLHNATDQPETINWSATAPAASGLLFTSPTGTAHVPADGQTNVYLFVMASKTAPQDFEPVSIDLTDGSYVLPAETGTVLVAPAGSLPTLFNGEGISDDTNQAAADFDGGGYSYSAQALAAAGLKPGKSFTADGATLMWPNSPSGSPDEVVTNGQTLKLNAPSGTQQVVFAGAATNGPAEAPATLNYSDGTSRTLELGFSDWTLNAASSKPSYGNVEIAATPYRNSTSGSSQKVNTYVFAASLPVDPAKTLVSVTLPMSSNLHVFAVSTTTTAPSGPVLNSVSPTELTAGATVTVTGTGFGATQGSGYVQFMDNGASWGAPGNAATFKVDSWSNTQITFTVPTPSGTNGVYHVWPGTPATVQVVNASGQQSDTAVVQIKSSANLADYFNNAGISPDNNQACANYDGDGYSYSADALAKAGLTPGGTVTSGGLTYTWPNAASCTADNILAAGQTILVNGTAGATTLGVLGSSTNGGSSGTIVINYTDGTSSTQTLSFNDWAGGPGSGNTAVATMGYRNANSGGSQAINMYVYATTVPVDSSKTVASVTLPDIASSVGQNTTAMHVFALSLGK
jgi:predicted alpha-1,2-mannosidase